MFSFKTSTVTWKELWGRCNKIREVKFKVNIKTLFHNDSIVWTMHRPLWTAAYAKIKKCYSNPGVLAFYFRLSRANLIAPTQLLLQHSFCFAPNTRALSPTTSHTQGAPVIDKWHVMILYNCSMCMLASLPEHKTSYNVGSNTLFLMFFSQEATLTVQ